MKQYSKFVAVAFCALALATSAFAAATTVASTAPTVSAPVENNWTFGLTGVGATSTKGSGDSGFGVAVDVGHTGKVFLPVQFGVRQSVSYANVDGSQTLLTTQVYNDWTVYKKGAFEVFAGANVGLTYGNTTPIWTIAPEAGVRYYVKKDVALVGRIAYAFDLSNLSGGDTYNTLGYSVGVQFSF